MLPLRVREWSHASHQTRFYFFIHRILRHHRVRRLRDLLFVRVEPPSSLQHLLVENLSPWFAPCLKSARRFRLFSPLIPKMPSMILPIFWFFHHFLRLPVAFWPLAYGSRPLAQKSVSSDDDHEHLVAEASSSLLISFRSADQHWNFTALVSLFWIIYGENNKNIPMWFKISNNWNWCTTIHEPTI